jgi:hypothetical protein
VVTGKPANAKIKLFPSEVQVAFLVGLSRYAGITPNDFYVTVPFAELKDGVTSVPVQLGKKPDLVNDLKITPQSVEFLIEK